MVVVYVESGGYYWNIPPKVFIAFCSKVIKTRDFFDFPRKYMLKNRPQRNVYKHPGSPENRSFSTRPNVVLFHANDWDTGDYLVAYREVAERLGIFQRRNPKTKLVGRDEFGFPIYRRELSRGRPMSG